MTKSIEYFNLNKYPPTLSSAMEAIFPTKVGSYKQINLGMK